MTLQWHVGDTRAVLPTLAPRSVNCVVTSSPYLAKRAYLPADDPLKPLEQGQEATPGEFLAGMIEVTDLLWDVLAADGVLFWNLGDTATAARGYGNPDSQNPAYGERAVHRWHEARVPRGFKRKDDGWPRTKSVCWVPELFGASLAYGRNLLTGEPCRQWITRPPLTWCKPNPSVGAIRDKFREATELIVFAVKQPRYWFDLDPVRVPSDYDRPNLRGNGARAADSQPPGQRRNASDHTTNGQGRPPYTWLDVDGGDLPAAVIGSPAQYPGVHYAVMPPWLARLLITVGCPPGGAVLDPYAGSGTTLDAAHSLGRSAVGIDLDPRNVALAQDRLGMFPLDVHDHTGART